MSSFSVGSKLLRYQILRNKEEEDDESSDESTVIERALKKARAWLKLKALAGTTRPKVRVPRLRRFLGRRTRLLSTFRVSWRKALEKLKNNGQSHMNDLFGGNYLFMHCNPTPFRVGVHKSHRVRVLHGLPSTTYSVRRIA